MFIQNKYTKWYNSIVTNAQLRIVPTSYTETHHIIPRSLGGDNTPKNLAVLTAREHFICHWLLTKMTIGQNKANMIYALNGMKRKRKHQERYETKITSRVYETLKAEFGRIHSERLTGRTLTEEHRAKIAKSGKGRIASPETIEKRRIANTGKKRTAEQKENIRRALKGRKPKDRTEEDKLVIAQKISVTHKGKAKSEEHKQKLSQAIKGIKKSPLSEETKQKMRKPKSEEHRKAISDARIAKYKALREAKS